MVAYSSHASTERAMIPASFIGTHQTLLFVDSDTWLMQPSNQAFIALHGFCGFGSPKTVADINNPERVLSLLRPFPFPYLPKLWFGSGNFYCCCAAATMDGFLETSQRREEGRKGIYDRTSYLRWHLAFNSSPSPGGGAIRILPVTLMPS